MKSYLIAYDPNRPAQYYTDFFDAVKKLGTCWHCLNSAFIVKADKSATQIGNYLSPYIDTSDKLLVVELTGEAAFSGFGEDCRHLLKETLDVKTD